MQVELIKEKGKEYVDKNGNKKQGMNYFVRCNEKLIPIKVANFSTDEKKDTQYAGRCAVLDSFATWKSDKENMQ